MTIAQLPKGIKYLPPHINASWAYFSNVISYTPGLGRQVSIKSASAIQWEYLRWAFDTSQNKYHNKTHCVTFVFGATSISILFNMRKNDGKRTLTIQQLMWRDQVKHPRSSQHVRWGGWFRWLGQIRGCNLASNYILFSTRLFLRLLVSPKIEKHLSLANCCCICLGDFGTYPLSLILKCLLASFTKVLPKLIIREYLNSNSREGFVCVLLYIIMVEPFTWIEWFR